VVTHKKGGDKVERCAGRLEKEIVNFLGGWDPSGQKQQSDPRIESKENA
jgi:hypothetical protein